MLRELSFEYLFLLYRKCLQFYIIVVQFSFKTSPTFIFKSFFPIVHFHHFCWISIGITFHTAKVNSGRKIKIKCWSYTNYPSVIGTRRINLLTYSFKDVFLSFLHLIIKFLIASFRIVTEAGKFNWLEIPIGNDYPTKSTVLMRILENCE